MTGRLVRAARAVGLLTAGALLVGSGQPGRAQEATPTAALAGFTGSAAASGLRVNYDPKGLLPLPGLVSVGAPDALATIASGPTTFARAAVLDPGDLVANPDAVFQQLSGDYPAGALPPYPYRISATSGLGEPTARSDPGPGLQARVEARPQASTAEATVGTSRTPGVATIRGAEATTATATDAGSVTVRARTAVTGLDVLGLLRVDSVVTELVARSDGTTTLLEGGTTVTGATLLGLPVTIDEDGVEVGPPPTGEDPLGTVVRDLVRPALRSLDDLLAAVGVRVSVAGPVALEGAGVGDRTAAGLRVDVELSPRTLPALARLLDAVPPIDNPVPGAPSVEDLLQVARANHVAAVEVAGARVSLDARTAAAPTAPVPTVGGTGGALPPLAIGSAPLPALAPTAPTATAGPAPAPAAAPVEPASSTGPAGIGALVLLALLVQPLLGDRLAGAAAAVLADRPADRCLQEGP